MITVLLFGPQDVKEKDINDMILSGYTTVEIKELIHSNTHKGLTGTNRFQFMETDIDIIGENKMGS